MLPASGTCRSLLLSSSQILTNGLDSMFVIFSFLEFCVAVAALAFGYNAIRQHNYMPMVRGGRGPVTAQSLGVLAPAFRRSGTALPTPFFPPR